MLKRSLRIISRAYPKGPARAEFLEATESDLHYAGELGISERDIERGAIRQALAHAWRHPRIGVTLTVLGMLFSVWLCARWQSYTFGYVVANGLWLALSWSVAVLCSRVPNLRLARPAILAFLLLIVAFVIKSNEWTDFRIVDYIDGSQIDYVGFTPPYVVHIRNDYGAYVMLFVGLASAAHVWTAVRLFVERAVVRGLLALAFAGAQFFWFAMATQTIGFWNLGDELAQRLPLVAAAWVVFFAAATWQWLTSRRRLAAAQR